MECTHSVLNHPTWSVQTMRTLCWDAITVQKELQTVSQLKQRTVYEQDT